MGQFLEKFKGKSCKIGREGILSILEKSFKPFKLGESYPLQLKSSLNDKANNFYDLSSRTNNMSINHKMSNSTNVSTYKSVQSPRKNQKTEQIVLPPINLTKQQIIKINTPGKSLKSKHIYRSAQKLSSVIKQRQKQMRTNTVQNSLPSTKHSFLQSKVKNGPFDVPNEMGYKVPGDQMRFLKSFQRYKSSQQFSIHRKMSQRFEIKQE